MKRIFILIIGLFIVCGLSARVKEVKLNIVETSDIHGNFFPYNFIEQKAWGGSLARVHTFVQKKREIYKDNLILIDNGDILQGQPSAYYYNFIDTVSTHLAARMMNFMGYNVGNMGNHDVETGHPVYDRWIKECNFPILGANIIRTVDESNYLKPYEVLVRDGVKIVVLGMITPAIPAWLPKGLWEGLRFDDMEKTAKKWMKVIKEKEKPDLVIGVFHAGKDEFLMAGKYRENASYSVAKNVPGFDIILMGHDHLRQCVKIVNIKGDSVLIIDPASNGAYVSDIDVKLTLKNGKVQSKKIKGMLSDVNKYGVSKSFMGKFASEYVEIEKFVSKKIGIFTETISTKPAYFKSSAFIDLIHALQLNITGADISFTAPLSFKAEIDKGDVFVSDMFSLYKYENMLYTMNLSGKEIKAYLEMSYALWTNQMKSPDDHLLLLKKSKLGNERQSFVNQSFNFDSAAGIIYTVDVTKPKGQKITIISMANGSPFEEDKIYRVALNSYRGNGGGELLTKGAGISSDELESRIITSTSKDLRYYLMNYIYKKQVISPKSLKQWKFIPEEWVNPAADRDYELLFKEKSPLFL
ncbi:MAG: bifunctional metallophosphatase/5'-nucleotidase [Bacteroides sp.]